MANWRCPHCGTPQVESSRCWVCRRSTTSCAACRNFRRGVAGGLGLCGLEPRRLALRGTEVRACWEAADIVDLADAAGPDPDPAPVREPVLAGAGGRTVRTFVPVEMLAPSAEDLRAGVAGVATMAIADDRVPAPAARTRRIPGGWSLWGDLEG